ncbi:MAG: DEAD/DEAH box helicase [Actinobacteria bacterium]|nr:DEAD/DEAH box helicase [Actinomycetota bacterium]
MTAAASRSAFEAGCDFALDPFQRRSLDALDAGRSVLVAAPTGSGKTLVAEYAVALALASGTKAYYTTPLKALSNQKYADLVRVHGPANVGLLTGDNAINGDAPVVVMTTEVLRNMIYAGSDTLERLRYVVLDEVHYLQNPYRGPVWEEVIIHLPLTVDLVCLSATVSNAEEFADWIRTVRGETVAIIEERRPVELTNLYAAAERGGGLHVLPTFSSGPGGEFRPNPEATRLDERNGGRGPRGAPGRPRSRLATPRRVEIVEWLAEQAMLPAITFIFSRAACDDAVRQCLAAGVRLTTRDERRELRRIADDRTGALSTDDLAALGYDEWRAGLEAGLAAHHAGMVPPMKEAVELAFGAGLVKAVFATETLSLGINMPARTVVIEKLSKFTGEHHEFLTPGEYTQLTGRAGRRGIDDRGYAVVLWNPFVPFDQVAGLASRRTYALTSSFRPTFNMAANLVSRYAAEEAHHLLNLSFAQYRADRDVVGLERRLERSQEALARQRDLACCERGDLDEYRALLRARDETRHDPQRARRVTEAIDRLRPGDVVRARRGGSAAVVLKHEGSRRGARVLALGVNRNLVRLGAADFDEPPQRITTIEMPRQYAPRSSAFRKEVLTALRRADLSAPLTPDPAAAEDERRAAEIAAHPVAGCPELALHLRAAVALDRLTREVARLERRVKGRSESLARQFDRVLRVLESWGYVDGWSLTDGGRLLTRIYAETDLLLAESIREHLLDGLDPPELAAVMSCFTYERRGPDGQRGLPPPHWPSSRVAKRARAIDRLWRALSANEDDAGLPETRPPDPGLAGALHAWADGDTLADVLGDEDELTGGDFVRHVKQVIDLLRQVADVAPDPDTAAVARAAADECFRGVVAASSLVRP